MRSRYSAYALCLADYIIRTTHPDNPQYCKDFGVWKQEILKFSKGTIFKGLKILEFVDGPSSATVTFTAILEQRGQDASFTEKSGFLKVGRSWVYHLPIKGPLL
jgi:SEC-C motif-containing protein